MKTKISEIFSSIQGEGLYLGKRQIFVRFYGCNMRCAYCDTVSSIYEELSVTDVLNRINSCLKDRVAVSLTGGEPLVHVVYLKLLLKELKTLGLKTYLETNGTLPGALNKVIDMVDIIAMDIKLPSSTHDSTFWDEHEAFLNIAKRREVFIKIIVTGDTKKDEFKQAVRIIQGVAPTIPLVIQPVTPYGSVPKASHTKLNNFYNHASSVLKDVRTIPQVHRIIGYR